MTTCEICNRDKTSLYRINDDATRDIIIQIMLTPDKMETHWINIDPKLKREQRTLRILAQVVNILDKTEGHKESVWVLITKQLSRVGCSSDQLDLLKSWVEPYYDFSEGT